MMRTPLHLLSSFFPFSTPHPHSTVPLQTMASATGIPDQTPASRGSEENEPLLGEPGDASQKSEKGIQFNFIIGRLEDHKKCCLSGANNW